MLSIEQSKKGNKTLVFTCNNGFKIYGSSKVAKKLFEAQDDKLVKEAKSLINQKYEPWRKDNAIKDIDNRATLFYQQTAYQLCIKGNHKSGVWCHFNLSDEEKYNLNRCIATCTTEHGQDYRTCFRAMYMHRFKALVMAYEIKQDILAMILSDNY